MPSRDFNRTRLRSDHSRTQGDHRGNCPNPNSRPRSCEDNPCVSRYCQRRQTAILHVLRRWLGVLGNGADGGIQQGLPVNPSTPVLHHESVFEVGGQQPTCSTGVFEAKASLAACLVRCMPWRIRRQHGTYVGHGSLTRMSNPGARQTLPHPDGYTPIGPTHGVPP